MFSVVLLINSRCSDSPQAYCFDFSTLPEAFYCYDLYRENSLVKYVGIVDLLRHDVITFQSPLHNFRVAEKELADALIRNCKFAGYVLGLTNGAIDFADRYAYLNNKKEGV